MGGRVRDDYYRYERRALRGEAALGQGSPRLMV
jgi:hypothetical protein